MATCYIHFDDYNIAITTDFLLYPTSRLNRPPLILGDHACTKYKIQDLISGKMSKNERPPSIPEAEMIQSELPSLCETDFEDPNIDIDPINDDNICSDNFPSGPYRDKIKNLIRLYTGRRVISSSLHGRRLTNIGEKKKLSLNNGSACSLS